jgi:hypothetical protein
MTLGSDESFVTYMPWKMVAIVCVVGGNCAGSLTVVPT